LREQNQARELATEIGDEIARLVLDGPPLMKLMQAVAERFENPVILEDGSRRAVAFGQYQSPITTLLKNWGSHARQPHRGDEIGVHETDGDDPRCLWTAIALRGEMWGRIHVLEVDTPISEATRRAFSRVASNVALYLLAERDAYISEAAERSLVTEVAHGPNFNAQDFVARASGLGVDLDSQLVSLVVGPAPNASDDSHVADQQEVRDALRRVRWPGLVGTIGTQVMVVASWPSEKAGEALLAELIGALHEEHPGWHVGLSRPAQASTLRRALPEAEAAHRSGPTAGPGPIHRYENLVLHRLLLPLLQAGPDLTNFVESELGELIRYDHDHSSELLHTLDAYLQNNGSKAATADALFLQRRSVYYRLTRIEQLLERSIDRPENRMRIYLALRALEVLESRQ
jgi:PucR family transcriptional regulator, purine catabolism regulatory protein